MLPLESYIREQSRPCGKPAFLQNWRDLLFLHFSCDPLTVGHLLPQGLELDTYPDGDGEERAWIGLVPFRMQDVRPTSLPAIPTATAFPETNVRTYVHRNGRPGVWFFSLDATSRLACIGGRNLFHLPYKEANMSVQRDGDLLTYESTRRSDGAHLRIRAETSGESGVGTPGTLEFFLVERYLLFAQKGAGWLCGDVHHAPYEIRSATVVDCEETLVRAAGIVPQPFTHTIFSEGVNVRVGGLRNAPSFLKN